MLVPIHHLVLQMLSIGMCPVVPTLEVHLPSSPWDIKNFAKLIWSDMKPGPKKNSFPNSHRLYASSNKELSMTKPLLNSRKCQNGVALIISHTHACCEIQMFYDPQECPKRAFELDHLTF